MVEICKRKYLRDTGYPYLLERLYRLEVMLSVYSAYGEEYERKAKDMLFGVANSRKAREGGEAGLLHFCVEGGTAFGRRQELQLLIRRSQGTVAGL